MLRCGRASPVRQDRHDQRRNAKVQKTQVSIPGLSIEIFLILWLIGRPAT